MIFRQITHDDLGCASYLIGDEKAGVAAVVACGTLLFYTNYFTAIGVLLALTVATPLCYPEWPFLRRLALAGNTHW